MSKNAFEKSVLKDMSRYALRRRILDQFSYNSEMRGFTLPGKAFAFEADISRDYGDRIKLYGVEKSPDVYRKALKLIKHAGIPMELSREDDLKYWGRPAKEKLNFVWLDYCAQWSSHQNKAIESLLENEHLSFKKANPIVALTVMASREPKASELVDEIYVDHLSRGGSPNEFNLCEARRVGIPRAINRSACRFDVTFVPQFIMKYHDVVRSKQANPMMLFVFEVMRGEWEVNKNRIPFIDADARREKDIVFH